MEKHSCTVPLTRALAATLMTREARQTEKLPVERVDTWQKATLIDTALLQHAVLFSAVERGPSWKASLVREDRQFVCLSLCPLFVTRGQRNRKGEEMRYCKPSNSVMITPEEKHLLLTVRLLPEPHTYGLIFLVLSLQLNETPVLAQQL